MGVIPELADPEDLVALGAFVGAQVLVVCFSVIKANAYRERPLLLHAAATMLAVLAVQAMAGRQDLFPQSVLLLVFALAGLQLSDLMSHAGALHRLRRWMLALSVVVLPLLALLSAWSLWALLAGVLVWTGAAAALLWGGWRQSRPWVAWLVPGSAALGAAGIVLGLGIHRAGEATVMPVAALLTLWAACVYLATGLRGRGLGETRARVKARNTVDPLTGLSMPMVLNERLQAARTMVQRYGHPSVLLLVHVENLRRLGEEFGPEAAESAMLSAANRVRESLRPGDVAARLTHSRIAVLAEGMSLAEGSANVASRILVAGLKEPLAAVPAEFLHFRIALAPVPAADIAPKQLLQRLDVRLEQELRTPSERRILAIGEEELLA